MASTEDPKPAATDLPTSQSTAQPMILSNELDEDPLLIAQTLTYVTDDGSVIRSFLSAPLSLGKHEGRALEIFYVRNT